MEVPKEKTSGKSGRFNPCLIGYLHPTILDNGLI